ncbi:outer membrane beta-barrel protein [Alistipes senegalensis]|uniref:outer membrane beta-barrel protein n=1 Tax=Alistipes senegalensis TaxID=1288121 RepID=UPI00242D4972|nr:outer membrane beta-barrel protein [Alistipes senegalensis]MCI7306765.1 outer membrane beta-barrel protein [Alistipes senegalensis]MDD7037669.1 outer membrane beta-barrel protein [Alistipes senegalensis]MDY2875809.1 outer membrane beta-barrel protein [Alistipes senegalensis]
MKRILLTTLLTFCTAAAFAQRGSVTATVVNADTGESVAGAVLIVSPVKTPEKQQGFTSAFKGAVSMPSLAYGEYKLSVSFIGYNNLDTTFRVSAPKLNLGVLKLKPGVQIETVVKEAKALRTSQKGDTVSYNAGAFKVVADADVEGLLKKMPGITVTDGTVEAQGETVKKIFVDGKEFFGEDVTTAIKSLPAEAVDRVEVYNKLSDAAEFSGMDDGEGYKALNIVTRPGMRQGQFGKLYAGFGYDADTETEDKFKYIAGGNANIFSGDSRISLIGLFNNVNQQNFSFEDILGVSGSGGGGRRGSVGQYMMRPQSGVATVNAIGINYSDSWGKRDQVTFQGSYFFNNTNTENRSTVEKWYEAPMRLDTLMTNGYSDTKGYNHRFNARLEWKISENQNLMIRPRFSYQSNDPWSRTTGWQFGAPADGGSGYSRTDNFSDALRHGYNVGTSAVYRAKLGKNGRTITLDGSFSYSDNTNNSNSWSNVLGTLPDRPGIAPDGTWDTTGYTKIRRLCNLAPSSSYSLRGSFTYTEPVAKYAQVSFQYRVSYNSQERDKRSYITGDDFSTAGLTPDRSLSNSYESGYLMQSVGPGFRFSKERNTFIANVYYQRSALDGQIVRDDAEKIKHAYNNVTYFMMGQLNINRENSLRLFVSSYTDSPSITDLQSVYDVSDAQNITHGNPNLKPTYSHRVNFHYTNSNVEKGRTFMWMFSMNTTLDYTASHLVQRPGEITIDGEAYSPNFYSTTTNLDGYWQLRTHLSYGLPIGFLKSNFNVMAGVIYTKTPSMLGGTVDSATGLITGGERNDTKNMGYDFRAVLGSNISENVDFTLSWNGTYNEATNSLNTDKSKNRYFNHTAQGNLKVVFPLGFTFTASAAYSQYIGFTNDYSEDYLLCNAWLGKKVFRNKRGEVMIGVNDLLNQNRAFSRTTGSGYTQNSTNSVIGRYYMVQFTYNLRRFGKKGSRNLKDYGVEQQSGSQRRMGPGGPGGPPPGGFHGGGPGGF